jgi:hypothetical protein
MPAQSHPKPCDQPTKLAGEERRSVGTLAPTEPLFARFASSPTLKQTP